MDKKVSTGFAVAIIAIIAIFFGGLFWWDYQNDLNKNNHSDIKTSTPAAPNSIRAGGECQYEKLAGTCKINEVLSDNTVKFNFSPATPISEDNIFREILNREQVSSLAELTNYNSVAVQRIQKGSALNCEASLITKGTCTPIMFKLIDSDSSNWTTYRNEKLGFEIKIPQMVSGVITNSSPKSPVKVIEKDNIAWIVAERDYSYEENLKKLNEEKTDFKKVEGTPWAILTKKVNSETELEKFIQNRYGKSCQLGEKKESSQSGVFDVAINASGPEGGCFLNFMLVVKYYPDKGLVSAWDLGQDVRFINDTETFHGLDPEMVESFKFLSEDVNNWKTYTNDEYGFEFKYPENKYILKEEPKLLHFYHAKCAHVTDLPKEDCINLNIEINDKSEDIRTLEDLIEQNKQGKLKYSIDLSHGYTIEKMGNNRFIVSKFLDKEIFYAVTFLTLSDDFYYTIKFGGQSNKIKESDYTTIKEIINSFVLN